jgi:hypothetical protein
MNRGLQAMKFKQLLIFWVLACSLVQPIWAATAYGIRDCGEWINRGKIEYEQLAVEEWLSGFMSGLSVMHELNGQKGNPLSKTKSTEQIYLWMDNYCLKNPLNDISGGGVALFVELMKKK